MTINQESFKQVEDFVVGAWNIEQTYSITTKGFVKVIDEGHITYHPQEDEYTVWDEASMQIATTKDKWKAYAIYITYTAELESKSVENIGCFREVSSVIGCERAKEELSKVMDELGDSVIFDSSSLLGAFCWGNTTQGSGFWNEINEAIKAKK